MAYIRSFPSEYILKNHFLKIQVSLYKGIYALCTVFGGTKQKNMRENITCPFSSEILLLVFYSFIFSVIFPGIYVFVLYL